MVGPGNALGISKEQKSHRPKPVALGRCRPGAAGAQAALLMADPLEMDLDQQAGGQDHGHAALSTGALCTRFIQLPRCASQCHHQALWEMLVCLHELLTLDFP